MNSSDAVGLKLERDAYIAAARTCLRSYEVSKALELASEFLVKARLAEGRYRDAVECLRDQADRMLNVGEGRITE